MAWILSSGDYSAYHVVGVLPSKEVADRLAAELAATVAAHPDYAVEEVPDLPADVAVRDHHYYSRQATWFADGTLYTDYGGHEATQYHDKPPEWSNVPEGCEVQRRPYMAHHPKATGERYARVAIQLQVGGLDIPRCEKVWTEQQAMILADPATAIVAAWVDYARTRGTFYTSDELLDYPENRAIAAAIRRGIEG